MGMGIVIFQYLAGQRGQMQSIRIRGWAFGALFAFGIVGFAVGVRADSIPKLVLSSPDDLSHLIAGQTITVDVSLQDLDTSGSDGFPFLAADVTYDPSLFGDAFNINPGAIVPDPADFLPDQGTGLAGGAFIPFGPEVINANGLFFSFQITSLQPGSGVFDFDRSAVFPYSSDDSSLTNGFGDPLAFTVEGSVATAPTPSPIWAGAALLAIVAIGPRVTAKRKVG